MSMLSNLTSCGGQDDARSVFQKILETQRQFSDNAIGKESSVEYYGWFSEEIQSKRIQNPLEHKLQTSTSLSTSIKSPPYTYWMQDGKKVLVTDVTTSPNVMKRHTESNAVFLGKIDEFYCRSYTKLR